MTIPGTFFVIINISPMDYNGESEILLSTTRLAITIKGTNLDNLFDHIIQHRVMWMKEPDGSFAAVDSGDVEITSIRFENLQ